MPKCFKSKRIYSTVCLVTVGSIVLSLAVNTITNAYALGDKPKDIELSKVAKEVVKQCDAYAKKENTPYQYFEGTLIEWRWLPTPADFNSYGQGSYRLFFEINGFSNPVAGFIGGKKTEIDARSTQLVKGKKYALCAAYNQYSMKEGEVRLDISPFYSLED